MAGDIQSEAIAGRGSSAGLSARPPAGERLLRRERRRERHPGALSRQAGAHEGQAARERLSPAIRVRGPSPVDQQQLQGRQLLHVHRAATSERLGEVEELGAVCRSWRGRAGFDDSHDRRIGPAVRGPPRSRCASCRDRAARHEPQATPNPRGLRPPRGRGPASPAAVGRPTSYVCAAAGDEPCGATASRRRARLSAMGRRTRASGGMGGPGAGRAVMRQRGHHQSETSVSSLVVSASGRLSIAFAGDGEVRFEPRATGFAGALARLLVPVVEGAPDRTWERVKACAETDCQWAFYDRSRNRSGRWCDMAVCGNRTKVRAYRATSAAGRNRDTQR